MHAQMRAFLRTWTDAFNEHRLLTYATAIAMRAFSGSTRLGVPRIALLGALGQQDVWQEHVAPAIEPNVTQPTYEAINAAVEKVFTSNSAGLIAFASVYAIWQASGSIRAAASYTSAAGNLLLLMVVVTYFYVSSVVFLIGAQLDEFLRQDAKGREVVGIHDLARRVFQ